MSKDKPLFKAGSLLTTKKELYGYAISDDFLFKSIKCNNIFVILNSSFVKKQKTEIEPRWFWRYKILLQNEIFYVDLEDRYQHIEVIS